MKNEICLVFFVYKNEYIDDTIRLVRIFTEENKMEEYLSNLQEAFNEYDGYFWPEKPSIVIKRFDYEGDIKYILNAQMLIVASSKSSNIYETEIINIFCGTAKAREYFRRRVDSACYTASTIIPSQLFSIHHDYVNSTTVDVTITKYSKGDIDVHFTPVLCERFGNVLIRDASKISVHVDQNGYVATAVFDHFIKLDEALKMIDEKVKEEVVAN